MFKVTVSSPKFRKTRARLDYLQKLKFHKILESYGKLGVAALARETPVDTGETAKSWSYKVVEKGGRYSLVWTNSVQVGGVPLVILLQYGHGTNGGGYVSGSDFINPALEPVLEALKKSLRAEVVK